MATSTRLAAAWAGWTGASVASIADLRRLGNNAERWRPRRTTAAARLAPQKLGDHRHEAGLLGPRPMARTLRDFDLRGAAESVRVGLREGRVDVRIALAPGHQRRTAQLPEPLPGAGQRVL